MIFFHSMENSVHLSPLTSRERESQLLFDNNEESEVVIGAHHFSSLRTRERERLIEFSERDLLIISEKKLCIRLEFVCFLSLLRSLQFDYIEELSRNISFHQI